MDYKYLLHSFLYFLGAFLYYKIHKWWSNDPKNKEETSVESLRFMIFFKNWSIIVILIFFSITSLIKCIK